MLDDVGGHLPAIYMHCSRSRKKTDLVCSSYQGGGPSASYPYMHCIRSRKKSDLIYQYARHLCWIDWGVHQPAIYMHCSRSRKKTDLVCSIYGGSICLWYLYVFSMHWYFLIFSYYLTISNGLSLATLNSIEFTQSSGSFKWGVPSAFDI